MANQRQDTCSMIAAGSSSSCRFRDRKFCSVELFMSCVTWLTLLMTFGRLQVFTIVLNSDYTTAAMFSYVESKPTQLIAWPLISVKQITLSRDHHDHRHAICHRRLTQFVMPSKKVEQDRVYGHGGSILWSIGSPGAKIKYPTWALMSEPRP